MEHEDRIYVMMMDALDGELAADEMAELHAYLQAHPSYRREWQALSAIDALFRHTPALSPAAGFTQRTLARLPNRQARLWSIGVIYVLLLLGGALPFLLGVWLVGRVGPVLREPALLSTAWQLIESWLQVAGTVLRAFVMGVGEFVIQEPTVLGWLLVIAGVIFLWAGVYRQLLSQPRAGFVTGDLER